MLSFMHSILQNLPGKTNRIQVISPDSIFVSISFQKYQGLGESLHHTHFIFLPHFLERRTNANWRKYNSVTYCRKKILYLPVLRFPSRPLHIPLKLSQVYNSDLFIVVINSMFTISWRTLSLKKDSFFTFDLLSFGNLSLRYTKNEWSGFKVWNCF